MTESAFDVFDVHHHVGRAFDALGGALDEPSVGSRGVRADRARQTGCGSWTQAASTRRW